MNLEIRPNLQKDTEKNGITFQEIELRGVFYKLTLEAKTTVTKTDIWD